MFATIAFKEKSTKFTPLFPDGRSLEVDYSPSLHLKVLHSLFKEGDTVWVLSFKIDEQDSIFICNRDEHFWSSNADIDSGSFKSALNKGELDKTIRQLVNAANEDWRKLDKYSSSPSEIG